MPSPGYHDAPLQHPGQHQTMIAFHRQRDFSRPACAAAPGTASAAAAKVAGVDREQVSTAREKASRQWYPYNLSRLWKLIDRAASQRFPESSASRKSKRPGRHITRCRASKKQLSQQSTLRFLPHLPVERKRPGSPQRKPPGDDLR